MPKHRKSKYVKGYGYINLQSKYPIVESLSGDGIADVLYSIFKAGNQILTKIPQRLIDSSKDAILNVGSSTIKAVGSRVSDAIAEKVMAKQRELSKIPSTELRKQILKEITFQPEIKKNKSTKSNSINQEDSEEHVQPPITSGIPSDLYKNFYGNGLKQK